jgi:serine/threonine protein kinase
MSKSLACPDAQVLRRFTRGELPEAQAEALSSHVLQCGRCAQALDALHARDPLLADLKGLQKLAPGNDSAADALIERLVQETPSAIATAVSQDSVGNGPNVTALNEPAPIRIGRYRIVQRLGAGGFGQVYLAEDEQLQRRVAIKVPHRYRIADRADADAYLSEARAVAALDHPHLVPVFDVGSTAEHPCYIVSKYIEGRTLAQRMAKERLSFREAAQLTATIAEALHHAHLRGLVHRDIKPGNILLDKAGQPFVADFGLALRDENVGRGPRFAGTPAYMSPEQARGDAHRVDGRSDICSLGVVFYELLAGRRPFQADEQTELLEQIAIREPRPLRQIDETIPRELERICLKALAKRITDRYLTAQDMADELRSYLARSSSTALPPTTPGRPMEAGDTTTLTDRGAPTPRLEGRRPPLPRRSVIIVAVAIVLTALLMTCGGVGLAWWAYSGRQGSPAADGPNLKTPEIAKQKTPANPPPREKTGDTGASPWAGKWREFSGELTTLLAPDSAGKHPDEAFLRVVEERLIEPFDAKELADVRRRRASAGIKTDPPVFLYLYTPAEPTPVGKRRGWVEIPESWTGQVAWWSILIPARGSIVKGTPTVTDAGATRRAFALLPAGDYRIVVAMVPLSADCEKQLRQNPAPAFIIQLGD